MRSCRTALALTVALSCAAQCDDGDSTATDASRDAAYVVDGGCVVAGQSCDQIGECGKGCGTNQSCVDTCATAGCETARTAFGAVNDCMIPKCWTRCTSGYSSDCEACSREQCATEYNACAANQCPLVCAQPHDGGFDAAQPLPDAATPTPLSCTQIYDCMGDCIVETPLFCTDVCSARGCTAAQSALQAMLSCADTSCSDILADDRCLTRYSTPECEACIQQRCAAAWQSCTEAGC